jgi:hypothetical protein
LEESGLAVLLLAGVLLTLLGVTAPVLTGLRVLVVLLVLLVVLLVVLAGSPVLLAAPLCMLLLLLLLLEGLRL